MVSVLDDAVRQHQRLQAHGRHDLAERFKRSIDGADRQLGALVAILSSTAVAVTGLATGGELLKVEITVTLAGTGAHNVKSLMHVANPATQELARHLHDIQQLSSSVGLASEPVHVLSDDHLAEHLIEFEPGSAIHKAPRWADYQARKGSWAFERWSNTYQQNMTSTGVDPSHRAARLERLEHRPAHHLEAPAGLVVLVGGLLARDNHGVARKANLLDDRVERCASVVEKRAHERYRLGQLCQQLLARPARVSLFIGPVGALAREIGQGFVQMAQDPAVVDDPGPDAAR